MLISCIEHDEAISKKNGEIRELQHLVRLLYNDPDDMRARRDAKKVLVKAGLLEKTSKPGRKGRG